MELTLHRALAMRKTTKERIRKELANATFIAITVGNANVVSGVPVEQVKKNIMGSYDKINALIANFEALNRGITRANAGITANVPPEETVIDNKRYTLADLIQLQEVISFKRELLRNMTLQCRQTLSKIEEIAVGVASRCDTFLASMAGGDKAKLSKEDIDAYTRSFHENNDARIVDPLGLKVLMPRMEQELADFSTEVDSRISELNALTKIEVEIKN